MLNKTGFVVDFGDLKRMVLEKAHLLLDHSLALSEEMYKKVENDLHRIGQALCATRDEKLDNSYKVLPAHEVLNGAIQRICGGIKIATFPFTPTSERLAEWLWGVAHHALVAGSSFERGLSIIRADVYETLHPVEAIATFFPEPGSAVRHS